MVGVLCVSAHARGRSCVETPEASEKDASLSVERAPSAAAKPCISFASSPSSVRTPYERGTLGDYFVGVLFWFDFVRVADGQPQQAETKLGGRPSLQPRAEAEPHSSIFTRHRLERQTTTKR